MSIFQNNYTINILLWNAADSLLSLLKIITDSLLSLSQPLHPNSVNISIYQVFQVELGLPQFILTVHAHTLPTQFRASYSGIPCFLFGPPHFLLGPFKSRIGNTLLSPCSSQRKSGEKTRSAPKIRCSENF